MCMHPPARSVAVLHLGHGFVVSRIATADDGSDIDASSAHRGARDDDDDVKVAIAKGAEDSEVDGAGSHSPMWKPCENTIGELILTKTIPIWAKSFEWSYTG